MNKSLVLLFCFLLLSYVLTYFIKWIALRNKILDMPNERSSHADPIPRGGGLAIVISWYTGISYLYFQSIISDKLYFALLSGIFLAIVSFIDDIKSIRPQLRLFIHIITAILAFILLNGIQPLSFAGLVLNSKIVLFPISVIGIVWFINLFNFLDGIDGYASMEAILVALVMFFLTESQVFLILIACTLGFLIWNWPKAKIFMGDIGSTQLGFILVVLGIYYHNEFKISFLHWIMITSVFWFDATLTLMRRWRNKEKLSVAHRKHAYQRAVQSGLSHNAVILLSIILNGIIFGIVVLSINFSEYLLPLFIINMLILYFVNHLIDRRMPFK